MDELINPLRVCDEADFIEQTRDIGADWAGLDDYPHTDHSGLDAVATGLSVVDRPVP